MIEHISSLPPTTLTLLIMGLVFGFYMAWNIGANDVANAMGTSVGSGALTLRNAVIVAAILEFSGAFFAGSEVSQTIRKGIVDIQSYTQAASTRYDDAQKDYTKWETLKGELEGEPEKEKKIVLAEYERAQKELETAESDLAERREAMKWNLVYGMLASLLAAGLWLQLASYKGWPVSTTHTIVGAVIGFGAVVFGMASINWGGVGKIVSSWVISPLTSGLIAFMIFNLIRHKIFFAHNPVERAKQLTPVLVFPVFAILSMVLFSKGLKHVPYFKTLSKENYFALIGFASLIGGIASIITWFLVRKIDPSQQITDDRRLQKVFIKRRLSKAVAQLKRAVAFGDEKTAEDVDQVINRIDEINENIPDPESDETSNTSYKSVERIFLYLQIISACFVAFAHGSNDVANAIGPFSVVVDITMNDNLPGDKTPVLKWVLFLGGIGIVIGLATWGWRVIETVGKRITELTPSRGFAAEFAAATTIVIASKMGLPISTTHTLVGAVLGVGLARGMGALNMSAVKDIIISWVVTVPAGAILSVIFFFIIQAIFS